VTATDLAAAAATAKAAGRLDEALKLYALAVTLQPDFIQARLNLGNVLTALDRPVDALLHYDLAIAQQPGYALAHLAKAVALTALNRHEDAIAAYDRALAIDPDFGAAEYGKALRLLQLGRYAEGWPLHEAHWRGAEPRPYPDTPYWTGVEPLAGKTVLVYAEQGLGDALQFYRFVPELVARGAKVILNVDPALRPLFVGRPEIDRLVTAGEKRPHFDYHVSLLSLPCALGTTLETMPGQAPYVFAPPDRVATWAERLPKSRLRIGLVWSGNPGHSNDRNRSMPLSALGPLLEVEAEFVCLHAAVRDADRPSLAASSIVDLTGEIKDFADTAAIVSTCDLVISVDTSVAHLAGAMGVAVWVLLPFSAEWRWMTERADSPWYPSAQLFRQGSPGDWAGLMSRALRGPAARPRAGILLASHPGSNTSTSTQATELHVLPHRWPP